MGNEVLIREGGLTAVSFSNLRAACGLPALDEDMLRKAVGASLFTLTANHGPGVVGMVRVVGDGAFVFFLTDLMVAPSWRRQGIGTRLTKEAIARAGRYVPKGYWTTMALFAAEGREHFYKRFGFLEMPIQGLGAGMQKIYRADKPFPELEATR